MFLQMGLVRRLCLQECINPPTWGLSVDLTFPPSYDSDCRFSSLLFLPLPFSLLNSSNCLIPRTPCRYTPWIYPLSTFCVAFTAQIVRQVSSVSAMLLPRSQFLLSCSLAPVSSTTTFVTTRDAMAATNHLNTLPVIRVSLSGDTVPAAVQTAPYPPSPVEAKYFYPLSPLWSLVLAPMSGSS